MGFQNIGRLKHGIIAYEKWLQSQAKEEKNTEEDDLFEGQNFLFDRRRLLEKEAELKFKEQQQATPEK